MESDRMSMIFVSDDGFDIDTSRNRAAMTKLEELKKLAENATPGPWVWPTVGLSDFVIVGADRLGLAHADSPRTAAFIAAANPQIILALIELVDQLAGALKYHQEQTRPIQKTKEVLTAYENFGEEPT